MDGNDAQLLDENPEWRLVLEEYQRLIEDSKNHRSDEETGTVWTQRMSHLSEIPPETLQTIHGQLIAMNWLTFQLEGRNAGLLYRITGEGRKALESVLVRSSEQTNLDAA